MSMTADDVIKPIDDVWNRYGQDDGATFAIEMFLNFSCAKLFLNYPTCKVIKYKKEK